LSLSRIRRWIAEGAVIVASILVAFSIDAWWETRQEREIERDAVAVLVRDLASAEEQLADFDVFAESKFTAAFDAARILLDPVAPEDEEAVVDLLMLATQRRTMSLPRSGYTELVSSGSLRFIRDPVLRDRILRFYQEAERTEEIVEKNSTVGTDGFVWGALVPTGLVASRPLMAELNDIMVERNARVEEALGPDFRVPRDRLWSYGPDSEEWAKVRGVLLHMGSVESSSSVLTRRLAADSEALRTDLEDYLAGLGG
jgi:hypothetical protein